MKKRDLTLDSLFLKDFQKQENSERLIYALKSFANQVDSTIQSELFRKLILYHAEISKRLQNTVEQLAERTESLTEAQQIAMLGRWDIDYRTNKRVWSDSLYDILHLDHSLLPDDKLFLKCVHPDDIPLVNGIIQELLDTHELWSSRYRILLPDGSIRWVHVRLTTVFDENHKPIRSYGTLQDVTAMKAAEDELERYSKQLEAMVAEKAKEISDSQMAMIFALVRLAESRDDDTGAHIERTASFCQLIAAKARELPQYQQIIDDDFIETIYLAAPLHDIGKVGISDLILLKPDKLTSEEFSIMKTHVEIGFQTLMNIDKRYHNNSFIHMGLDITRYHHEKYDGSGYLQGLKGEEIPLSARIMTLADVYDALCSKRVYKPAFSHENALEIIKEGRGKHFDPTLIDLFTMHQKEFENLYDQLSG
jgi:putative two-component system response regulator